MRWASDPFFHNSLQPVMLWERDANAAWLLACAHRSDYASGALRLLEEKAHISLPHIIVYQEENSRRMQLSFEKTNCWTRCSGIKLRKVMGLFVTWQCSRTLLGKKYSSYKSEEISTVVNFSIIITVYGVVAFCINFLAVLDLYSFPQKWYGLNIFFL